MISLGTKLEECQFKADTISGKVAEKIEDLEKAEFAWSGDIRKAEALEIVIRALRSE